jgi:hypothetical protein
MAEASIRKLFSGPEFSFSHFGKWTLVLAAKRRPLFRPFVT